jgi:hypothetical protein
MLTGRASSLASQLPQGVRAPLIFHVVKRARRRVLTVYRTVQFSAPATFKKITELVKKP